jgi:formamidopyrimidine-DNA glycosylase
LFLVAGAVVPELPEVETVRRGLAPAMVGCLVERAVLHRKDYCVRSAGGPCRPRDLLEGAVVRAVERHGKQLAFIAEDGRVLVAHLGMSGQLRALAPGVEPPRSTHVHAVWMLDGGGRVIFRDPRRFGGLWVLKGEAELRERWSRLGPDGLEITGEQLRERAGQSLRAIKAVLLDQSVVAGVGNIYADEALFLSRIHPLRAARSLRAEEYDSLAAAIRRTLLAAIAAKGSTLRDYRDASGEPGDAQAGHAVYGRAGEPCYGCHGKLKGMRVAQRATVWCPRCQPRTRRRARGS